MQLRQHLAGSSGNDLVYVCIKKGRGAGATGFCFIGKAADVPDRYLDAEVMETFPHTVNYPGTAYRVDLEPLKSEKQGKWFYGETGLKWTLPEDRNGICADDGPWERLMIAIFESAANVYRIHLQKAIAEHHPQNEEGFNRVLRELSKKPRRPVWATEAQIRRTLRKQQWYDDMMNCLELLDTSSGRYIIQRIKDEELVKILHPELLKISDPKERAKKADRLRAELVKERVRIKKWQKT